MNYLAHLALSHYDADLQVGNFLGDIVRGSELATLPAGVQRGVWMHRAIDLLTDRDRDVRRVNGLLSRRHGRYAPVISDIMFDYFLCRNWASLMPQPFPEFRERTYARLRAATDAIPPRAARQLTGMTDGDWLRLYASTAGMGEVFRRMRPRMSKPALLAGVGESLQEYHDELNRTLLLLFPRLQALAHQYPPNQPSRGSGTD